MNTRPLTLILSAISLLSVFTVALLGCAGQPAPVPQTGNPSTSPVSTNPGSSVSVTQTSPSASLRVHFLDLGEGNAEIVEIAGKTMLIDAGAESDTSTLLKDIQSLGIDRFDVVVATLPSAERIGGMDEIIDRFEIGTFYIPWVSTNSEEYANLKAAAARKGLTLTPPQAGQTLSLGPASFTLLTPNNVRYEQFGDYSIVTRLTYGSTSFLFTGDGQSDSEREMTNRGYYLKSDVVLVSQHNSTVYPSQSFLNTVSPRLAVLQTGKTSTADSTRSTALNNMLMKLSNIGTKVYRTDLNGTVTVVSDGRMLQITTEHDS